jgi:hypothetical protein
MSANETPDGVNDSLGYVSPNISSAEEQEEQKEEELDEAALEQKKRETVQLDGIPIDEKDIKFKATEIRRKADISYFVNVAEPEENPKAEQKAANGKPAGDKKPFDIKNITAFINKPKTAQPEGKKAEKVDIVAKLKSIFLDGWHKYVTIGVVAAVVILIGCMIIIPIIEKNASKPGDDPGTGEVKIYDNPLDRLKDTEAVNAFLNYDFETVDRIYSEVEEELKTDEEVAKLYIDKAKRILDADPTEIDRIYSAADKAFKKGSDNADIVKELYVIYGLLGDKEKAEEMNETLISLGVNIDDDDEDDKKDDDKKEDSDKKTDDKKTDDKKQTGDTTVKEDKTKDTTKKPETNE